MPRAADERAARLEEHLADSIYLASSSGMNTGLPAQIEALFLRCPALCGFSVRALEELPDNYPRSASPEGDLYVDDVGVSPALSEEQFGEIFREIAAALVELLAEKPEAGEALRGRTFARVLH
jgi:hypothetical protein